MRSIIATGLMSTALPWCPPRMNRIASSSSSYRLLAGVTVLAAIGLSGCAQNASNPLGISVPYRMDLVQGNVVTKELMERVKPGLKRNQVRELLGTPMLTDAFHADRWDYVFTLERQGSKPQRQALVLHFEGDVLKRVEAPATLPTEKEFVAGISRSTAKTTEPKMALTDAERKALAVPQRPSTPAAEPMGAQRPYPPLEPQ
jgi:outer membrane protein assembly factor BamE